MTVDGRMSFDFDSLLKESVNIHGHICLGHERGVSIAPEDMPGRPLGRVRCTMCDEYVQDKREVTENGQHLCRACANGRYYGIENNTYG